jgi:type II secretory pathway pseudopilin PulG
MKNSPHPVSAFAGARSRRTGSRSAFSIVEFLVAFTIFAILMTLLFGSVAPVTKAWMDSKRRVESHQRARGALELLTRELTPAVVDTRMQLVVIPGEILSDVGAPHVAPESPALLWMAPLGTGGEIRCIGYYLYRDDARQFYRFKRIYIQPRLDDSTEQNPRFPRLVNYDDTRDLSMRTNPTSAEWFLSRWDEDAFDEVKLRKVPPIVSTAADGVIGLWVQCHDLLGNPVPLLSKSKHHPKSDLFYNSAAYFQMATTEPFDDGSSTTYLAETPQVMKANRIPSAISITLVTIDSDVVIEGRQIPVIENTFNADGSLDMETSVRTFLDQLQANNVRGAEVFSTKVKLVNGT